MNIDFVQIGANIGNTDNDPVYPRVVSKEFTSGMLIEANPNCFPELKKNYNNHAGIFFENVAISNKIGQIPFYVDNILNNNGTSQHSSTSLHFQHAHAHKDSEITTLLVDCTTLEELLEKRRIGKVKWLFVDTEGHDFDILINTDFSKLDIDYIQFEHLHTDGAHNKGENYQKLLSYLEKFGYKVVETKIEDTILKRSI